MDFSFALRSLRRSPGHLSAAVLCLAAGMAVCVAAFSMINALLFNDLPGIEQRSRLARVHLGYTGVFGAETINGAPVSADRFSTRDFEIFQSTPSTAFTSVAAEGIVAATIADSGLQLRTRGAFVSTRYFETLGTQPGQGRLLAASDFGPEAAPVAVIGAALGRHLNGDRNDSAALLGRSIRVNGRFVTIVGIAPDQFTGIQPAEPLASPMTSVQVWMPLSQAPADPGVPAATDVWHNVIARLAPGETIASAETQVAAAAAAIEASASDQRGGAVISLRSHGINPADAPGRALAVVALFMAIPLCILAISCANVANLQLARSTVKLRELSVRLALGASRRQAIAALVYESAAVGVLGAGLGIAVASALLRLAEQVSPVPLPVDLRVIAFSACLVGGVTILSGWMPAWIAVTRASILGLKSTAQAGGLGHSRLRNGLVMVQVALSLALLFITALALRSVQAVTTHIPERASQVLVLALAGPDGDSKATLSRRDTHDLTDRLTADSRITGAGFSSINLFATGARYWLDTDGPDARRYASTGVTTPGWFGTVGASLMTGRLWTEGETDAVVISEAMADRLLPHGPVLGQRLRLQTETNAPQRSVTVIGIVNDPVTRADGTTLPSVYLPFSDSSDQPATLYVATQDTAATAEVQRDVLSLLASTSTLTLRGSTTLADQLSTLSTTGRWIAVGFGGLGLLALVLAGTGLFAVMGYVVSLRTRELGIRMAIGARPAEVVSLTLRQSVRLVLTGSIAGFALAIPLAFAMRASLVGVSPLDPLAMIPTIALLVLTGLAAAAVPAYRASQVDPTRTLNQG